MRTVVSRTRVSRIVNELEHAGHVERLADPDDGRATLASLTESGRTALKQAAPVYLRGIEQHFTRHLSMSDQRAIARALQRVIDAHDAVADPRR
jgi:DNA-binding MarR family transcriptional regulator